MADKEKVAKAKKSTEKASKVPALSEEQPVQECQGDMPEQEGVYVSTLKGSPLEEDSDMMVFPSLADTNARYVAHMDDPGFRVRYAEDGFRIHVTLHRLRARSEYMAVDIEADKLESLLQAARKFAEEGPEIGL